MRFNPDIHHRRSIRLRGYNYADDGTYFMTVCIHQRECLLGEVVAGEMVPSPAGRSCGQSGMDCRSGSRM
jgi:hypothetical protein